MLFAWFIAGCLLVFSKSNRVVFDDTQSPFFCSRFIFLFAYWAIVLESIWILVGIIGVLGAFFVLSLMRLTGHGLHQGL
jgi:hypothetical protein